MKKDSMASVLAWGIPVSLAGGGYLLPVPVSGITFDLFRIFILIGGVIGGIYLFTNFSSAPSTVKKFAIVLKIWFGIALFSYLYVLDKTEWAKDIFYMIIGGSVFLSLYYVVSKQKVRNFVYAWMVGYICNLLFGFYEMYSGAHIRSGFADALQLLSPEHHTNFSPAGFFGNPNHYALFIIFTFLLLIKNKDYFSERNWYLFLFPGIWQLFETGSKFSIFAFGILLIYVIYNNAINRKEKVLSQPLAIIFGLLFFAIFILSLNFKGVEIKNYSEINRIELQKTDPDLRPKSKDTRRALIYNGWEFIKQSKGFGIGAGQFSVYIKKGKGKYDTGELTDPHSGLIEVASQYGVLIILLLGWFFSDWLRLLIKNKGEVVPGVIILLIILITQNVNSGYVSSPLNWLILIFPVIWLLPAKITELK